MAKGTVAKDIGGRLATARDERRLSQTDIAVALGVTRGAVGQWETGTAPSTENLIQAALELDVSFEWLATGRGDKRLPPAEPKPPPRMTSVPLVSWVSAGRLADPGTQIPVEDVPLLAYADLGRGEFFALTVRGDSMDRVSPDGSVIVVNRRERELIPGKAFVFSVRGDTTYKIWRPDPDRLEPYSTNPANQAIYIRRQRDMEVIGRVRRTVLDL
jgi:SOS-response transcriptional repressor LexA